MSRLTVAIFCPKIENVSVRDMSGFSQEAEDKVQIVPGDVYPQRMVNALIRQQLGEFERGTGAAQEDVNAILVTDCGI